MKIEGFTIFWAPGKRAWQVSMKVQGENGWLISHVSEEEARRLLRAVESVGPADGLAVSFRRLCAALEKWAGRLSR